MHVRTLAVALCALALVGCKKDSSAPKSTATRIGMVTDVGGRGDQSFNDSALRGLELWAAGKKFAGSGYVPISASELQSSIPPELAGANIHPLPIEPLALQSNAPEDYEPNLQLLVDRGASLIVGNGFMLAQAVGTVAARNPNAQFLLIDARMVDASGKPIALTNVRSVTFREEEGSYLAGALAGLVTKTNKVAFVGGMQIPLIRKFEAGFRAGLSKTNPGATLLVNYTGSFNNVAAGKQVGADVVAKDADVVYHAAGSDGLGVISAVKEARDAGKNVWVIGVDSDQYARAPNAVLTSMVKHVDYAVYQAIDDLLAHRFSAGSQALGLKENAVALAPVRIDFPGKAEALAKVDELRKQIVAGQIQVPST
jgi:basic membrane protein A